MFRRSFINLFILFISLNCTAQSLFIPKNIEAAYGKETRSQDGRPGKNYWQNHADYTINVSFDPSSRKLNGTVEIIYTNNSPDTLRELLFKLYPNYYKKGSPRLNSISP